MDMENVVGWALLFGVPFVLVYSFLKYRAYRARKEQEAFDREYAMIVERAAAKRERARKEREAFEARAKFASTSPAVVPKKAVPAKKVEPRQVVTDSTDDLVTQTILYNALTSANDTFGANVTYDNYDRPTITEVPKSTWSDDSPSKSSSWSSSSSDSSSSWSGSDTGSSSSWD